MVEHKSYTSYDIWIVSLAAEGISGELGRWLASEH